MYQQVAEGKVQLTFLNRRNYKMMLDRKEFKSQLLKMTDLSAAQANNHWLDIKEMAELAFQLKPKAVYTLPSMTKQLCSYMKGSDVIVGGTVGFPSGASTSFIKQEEAEELLRFGCGELDMVMNQMALKSGMYELVEEDIAGIVKLNPKIPVKVILEVNNLTEEEMRIGCYLAIQAGARFVKTGTGWNPKPTTLQQIKILKESSEGRIEIKAAGGIRNLETAYKMYQEGVSRFGIGYRSLMKILSDEV